MIELLGKLPDQLIGVTLAAGLWFGFHYLVLADRAMERQAAAELVPACEADVARMQNRSDAVLAPLESLRQLPFGARPWPWSSSSSASPGSSGGRSASAAPGAAGRRSALTMPSTPPRCG